LALLLVVLLDLAGEDVVVPAVDFDLVGGEGSGDGGLDFEVEVLGDDVASDDGGELGVFAVFGVEGLLVGEGALNVLEPSAGFGKPGWVGAVEGGFERSAIGMAADDGVLYVEDFDGVLDGGGSAVDVGSGDRDDVACVAADEEISGTGLEDEVGDDAGVRTGDEEPFGGLHLGEEMELGFFVREDVAEKAAVAFDEGFDVVDRFVGHVLSLGFCALDSVAHWGYWVDEMPARVRAAGGPTMQRQV